MQPVPFPVSGPLSVPRGQRKARWLHTGLAALMTLIVVVGFWPSYFGPMLRGVVARPWVIQLHGVVYVGWMALLLTQVGLVASGRTAAHRKLGNFGIGYGVLVFIMGVVVSFAAPLLHVAAGEWTTDEAARFLIIPLGDMALFGGFFGAAMLYRRKPQIHKRLILLATVALLFAAVSRMGFGRGPVFLLIWLSPVLAGIGYDIFATRRVHRTYLVGLAILLIGFSRVLFLQSEFVLGMGRALLRPLM